jgi:hypothetical protein
VIIMRGSLILGCIFLLVSSCLEVDTTIYDQDPISIEFRRLSSDFSFDLDKLENTYWEIDFRIGYRYLNDAWVIDRQEGYEDWVRFEKDEWTGQNVFSIFSLDYRKATYSVDSHRIFVERSGATPGRTFFVTEFSKDRLVFVVENSTPNGYRFDQHHFKRAVN